MKHEFLRKPRKQREIKKNYIPSILLSILFWMLLILMIVFVDPSLIQNFVLLDSYILFFLVLFLALFFSTSLILFSSRKGFLMSTFLCVFLFLRLKSLGNVINLGLLLLFFVLLEIYWGGIARRKVV